MPQKIHFVASFFCYWLLKFIWKMRKIHALRIQQEFEGVPKINFPKKIEVTHFISSAFLNFRIRNIIFLHNFAKCFDVWQIGSLRDV